MNDPDHPPTKRNTGSATVRLLAIAALGAGACIAVAAIAAALSFVF
jgi:hypothetical protein